LLSQAVERFVTQLGLSSFAIFTSLGPTTHSAHVNTTITIDNLHTSVTFDWSNAFCSQELNHGTLLKSHRVFIAQFQFKENCRKTIQHKELTPYEMLRKKQQNMPEVSTCLCCHLLMSYEGGGITFHQSS
jgi:hypothetical protein